MKYLRGTLVIPIFVEIAWK